MTDPTRQLLRLRSMYAEQESDCLVFQQKDQAQGGGLELVETPFAVLHMEKVRVFISSEPAVYCCCRRLIAAVCDASQSGSNSFWCCFESCRQDRQRLRNAEYKTTDIPNVTLDVDGL